MRKWILITFAILIVIGAINDSEQQHQEEQKVQNAYDREDWRRMVEGNWDDVENQWADLTIEQLRGFMAAGVDIHAKNNYIGDTPLHRAATFNDNADVIKELINAGADIHARDNRGRTPLSRAARDNGNADVIKELNKAGADVNSQTSGSGWTPLHYAAAFNGNTQVIKELINAGAYINAKNILDKTPCDILKSNYELKNNSEAEKMLCR